MSEETIAAIATPFGEGAIALLRVTGSRAREVVDACFGGKLKARTAQLGALTAEDGQPIDEVLATLFSAPNSYTGEDVVEISCHGGVFVTGQVLQRLLDCGARPAEPGEFTQRAFLNGKMDLTQAEAVMDLIGARTELALRSANQQLAGRMGEGMHVLRAELLSVLAHLEAYIDFPDEDIDTDTGQKLIARLNALRGQIDSLLATAGEGRVLREGVVTAICGEPNVGKSSLLNALVGFDRAIVSPTAGTTRDTLEELVNLKGIPFRLIDTAGVREAGDAIEEQGIARARKALEEADLVLEVVDAHVSPEEATRQEIDDPNRHLLVLNKGDLGQHAGWEGAEGISISCESGSGLETLVEALRERLAEGGIQLGQNPVAINARHRDCLGRAQGFLEAGITGLESQLSPEFVAIELRSGLAAVGEVVGLVDTEEILGEIFSSFCIGK